MESGVGYEFILDGMSGDWFVSFGSGKRRKGGLAYGDEFDSNELCNFEEIPRSWDAEEKGYWVAEITQDQLDG